MDLTDSSQLFKLRLTKFSDFIALLVMLLMCGENDIDEWNRTFTPTRQTA